MISKVKMMILRIMKKVTPSTSMAKKLYIVLVPLFYDFFLSVVRNKKNLRKSLYSGINARLVKICLSEMKEVRMMIAFYSFLFCAAGWSQSYKLLQSQLQAKKASLNPPNKVGNCFASVVTNTHTNIGVMRIFSLTEIV